MPNWGEVLNELKSELHPLDKMRKKYLKLAADYTGRNVIAYYSGWLQKNTNPAVSIDDSDKNGFMETIHGLDKSKGLDLILHTPGGEISATESIVLYLKSIFGNDIRVIVPQMAMSAGTMIALASKKIVMGKESCLGPIDPQFGGVSCAGVIEEFEKAKQDIVKNIQYVHLWQNIIGQYHPTFLGDCEKAISWAKEIVMQWLKENMFHNEKNSAKMADKIVMHLSSHKDTKSHSRHIHIEECKKIGLKVESLEDMYKCEKEDCRDYQDCILTIHHTYMHTFSQSNSIKIIENNIGNAMITAGGN